MNTKACCLVHTIGLLIIATDSKSAWSSCALQIAFAVAIKVSSRRLVTSSVLWADTYRSGTHMFDPGGLVPHVAACPRALDLPRPLCQPFCSLSIDSTILAYLPREPRLHETISSLKLHVAMRLSSTNVLVECRPSERPYTHKTRVHLDSPETHS